MNKNYTQIAEVIIPWHDDEESQTMLHIFDITDNEALRLETIGWSTDYQFYSYAAVKQEIMDTLGVSNDYGVLPGAPFHRYSAELVSPHTVMLWDTLAYNV